ncbi:hypothetical protein MSG28_000342 [Choristoneura fumiferana]|uniref:Uncharacterized protein n=2 Tax=Choristoneura fumiferana TaxID=7141 RepID=A0ACC0K0Q0_CHOFU|nr:hypothetical protein MSG28_000342 [Choristoneura fumiferana]KAI8429837.1 hypothetical protein MSG28_000342 [Choristoneura fumiferana]
MPSHTIQSNLMLEELVSSAVSIDVHTGDEAARYEGRVVHIVGPLRILEPISEPDYNIQVQAVKLRKRVQMYQWIEETTEQENFLSEPAEESQKTYWYHKDWRDYVVDSNLFYIRPGHHNPTSMPLFSETHIAENVKIGWLFLGVDVKRKVNDYYEIWSDSRPERSDIKLHSGFYYHGESALQHEVGDLRIHFSYAGREDDIQLHDLESRAANVNTWKYRILGFVQVFASAMTLHPDWITLLVHKPTFGAIMLGVWEAASAGEVLCALGRVRVRTVTRQDQPFARLGFSVPPAPLQPERAFNTCAVVSSSGALLGSGLGSFIGFSTSDLHLTNTTLQAIYCTSDKKKMPSHTIQSNLMLEELVSSAVSIDVHTGDEAARYEGRVVHIVGPLRILEPISEPDYNIQVQAVKLRKRVQMYQWIEETTEQENFLSEPAEESQKTYWYHKDWRDYVVDSNLFYIRPGHHNPTSMPLFSETHIAENVKIGWLFLGVDVKRKVNDYYEIWSDSRPERSDIKLHSGFYYHGESALQHEVGDLRIHFSYAGREDDIGLYFMNGVSRVGEGGDCGLQAADVNDPVRAAQAPAAKVPSPLHRHPSLFLVFLYVAVTLSANTNLL